MERGRLVRGGKVDEMASTEGLTRAVRFSWLGDGAAIEPRLKTDPHVSNLMLHGTAGGFAYSGDEEGLASLLASLIAAGIRIKSFAETQQTIEQLYLEVVGQKNSS
jgi:hypothetical protein